MARGYIGQIISINLSNGEISEEQLNEDLCRHFLGGYGLGARLLYSRMRAGVDPLGPENILGFVTGPLTGTDAFQGNRFAVVCKSPLTGGWGDSNCGGTFGPHLKFAGYDGVFFTGIADHPVYLFIENGKPELRDASELWGKDTYQIDDILKEIHGSDTESACIGPAGEKQSLISCIINDKGRAAGRSGVGAVMGSKKLKAVAVSGSFPVEVSDKERVKQLRKEYLAKRGPEYERFQNWGTIGLLQWSTETGDAPVKNWTGAGYKDFEEGIKEFERSRIMSYKTKRYGCWHCNIACGGHMQVNEGLYSGAWSHQVEYETAAAFGTMCLIDDFPAIIKINELVTRAGLDSISAGCAVAFAIDCFEHGVLTNEDTGGLELHWGNKEAVVKLTEQMAAGEGLGALLSRGVKRAAEQIGEGAEKYAVHAGGQEIPMHDPRFIPGLATTYQMDATPGRHTQGGELLPPVDWDQPLPNKYDYSGKGETTKKLHSLLQVINAAGLCLFGYLSYPVQYLPDFLSAITGWDITLDDCYKIGERIINMRHAFNLREGINPIVDFRLPDIVVGNPPLKEGELSGVTVDVETQREEYCQAMAWDPETARPSADRLRELDLDFLLNDVTM
jgi:aldehyde:ferredoxin oxidoreductase